MAIHTFLDPKTGNELFIDFDGSPAERGGGTSGNSYCGTRTSFTYFPLTQKNQWENVPLNTIERIEKRNSAIPFKIQDNGFYVVGTNVEFISDKKNDFALAVRILKDGTDEVLRNYVRIIDEDKKQLETFYDYQYLQRGEILTLEVTHSLGNTVLEYGALWVFRLDEQDELPKAPCIKHYYKLNEGAGNRVDSTSESPITLLNKNNPLSTVGTVGDAASFDNSLFQALHANIDPLSYDDGFTISGYISVTLPSDSYSVLAARWVGSNNTTEDQFILYHDHITNTFRFAWRETTGVYRILQSADSFIPTDFNHLVVTYSKISNHVRLYLNGRLQAFRETSGFTTTTSQSFSIGAYNISSNNLLEHSTCAVDEVFICCREYDADDVNDVYNDGTAITYEDLIDLDTESGEGGSGGGITLPIDATDVLFDNSIAMLPGPPSTVQTAIEAVAAAVPSYQQSILFGNWFLDVVEGAYRYDIPFSTHGISNPSFIEVVRTDGGFYHFGAHCEARVDTTTKNINLFVNDVPDGRFSGRVSIIGI